MTSTQSVPQKQQRKKASVKPTKQKTQEEIKGEYLLFNGDRKDPFEEVKKGKTRKKSKAERQEELLHMLYPPVTLHDRKENLDNKYRDQHKDYSKHHGKLAPGKPFDESEGSEKKPKRRKKINEEEEDFLNQIYQPVTVNEEWVKEYERGLRPTIPQNMSKHEYVRGFYTYGTSDEKVETCATTSFNDTTLNNQAGYFPNDTNLFSSQEKIKFQEVINMYNKYAKQFLQEAISTRKSRKKTAETTTLEVNTEGAVMFAMEQILRRNWTRPFIQCNWSNFVYY
uniref:Uncharacterized protein n=2 Tax=Cacopsylla melanoneura TaxID=428564 RepID=A0A8D8TE96_9HEMI